ncbi:optomotor-blind protein [Caerostris extrusa]|uniref:Optomotor-blind protein n=1 Tax=Caerostris extrusa TaxID=172846 RepID=A0AAV4X3L2_CAEEX|nr:optomotor-blind protein [Caerostris extrusa]
MVCGSSLFSNVPIPFPRRQAMLLSQQRSQSPHHSGAQHLPSSTSGAGAHHDAEESSDDDEKVDVGGTADLQASVASLSCGKDDVSSRDERRENGCTKDRDDSNDDSMEKPLSSLNNLEHNGSSRDYKNECLDSLSGLPKISATECDRRPWHATPTSSAVFISTSFVLFEHEPFTSFTAFPAWSHLFLRSQSSLPLSLFTSSGHPSPAAFTASHLAQSSLNSSSQGVGSLPSMGHNLFAECSTGVCCRSPMFHGYPPTHALDGSLPTGASGNGGLLATAGTVGGKVKSLRFSPYPLPLTTMTSTTPATPLTVPNRSDCGSSDGSVGPSSVSSSSDLKNIENMVNGLERQQEQLAAETLTRLTEK